jgi:hypothetical protein
MVNRLSKQGRIEIIQRAGFLKPTDQHLKNSRMTVWHRLAMNFSEYLAHRAGVYCLLELTDEKTGKRADCFIFPTGISDDGVVVQWEASPTRKQIELYSSDAFFPHAPDVLTLDYNVLWANFDRVQNYLEDDTYGGLLKSWSTIHQLPYPEMFDWGDYWKKWR